MTRIIYDTDEEISSTRPAKRRRIIIDDDSDETSTTLSKSDESETNSSDSSPESKNSSSPDSSTNTSSYRLSRSTSSTSSTSLSSDGSIEYVNENLSDLGCNLNDILPNNRRRYAAQNGQCRRLTNDSANDDINEIIDEGMGTSSNVPDRKTKAGTFRKESTRGKEEAGSDSDSDSLDGFIVNDNDELEYDENSSEC